MIPRHPISTRAYPPLPHTPLILSRFPYCLSFTFMRTPQYIKPIGAKTSLLADLAAKLVIGGNCIRTAYGNGSMSQTCSLLQMLDVAPVYRRFAGLGKDKALAMGIDTVMIDRKSTRLNSSH